MKNILSIFLLTTLIGLITSCKHQTQTGTLYYTPNCATIEGIINLDNGETVVFRQEIDEEFQQVNGIKVRVTYETKDSQPLTADCHMGPIIEIEHIEKQ
jgi:hypothetical protein